MGEIGDALKNMHNLPCAVWHFVDIQALLGNNECGDRGSVRHDWHGTVNNWHIRGYVAQDALEGLAPSGGWTSSVAGGLRFAIILP